MFIIIRINWDKMGGDMIAFNKIIIIYSLAHSKPIIRIGKYFDSILRLLIAYEEPPKRYGLRYSVILTHLHIFNLSMTIYLHIQHASQVIYISNLYMVIREICSSIELNKFGLHIMSLLQIRPFLKRVYI